MPIPDELLATAEPETCPSCDGEGTCPDCDGGDADCRYCNGSSECPECDGKGVLTNSENEDG